MIEIGGYKLTSVEAGEFGLDGGAMFGIVPKPIWEKSVRVDPQNRIDLRLRLLLIQGVGKNILVETGIEKGDKKFNDIYRVDHSKFSLDKSLSEKGLTRNDITDVIITHLHFDHAGGATVVGPGGKIVPTFPNARYHIQKKQYEWALSGGGREEASYRKEDFVPLVEAGRVNFLDGKTELFPDIFIHVSFGHTEAQQHVCVTDGRKTLYHTADMIPTSAHIGLQWIMGYDIRPLTTLEERKRLYEVAVAGDWVLFFNHCPSCPAATIRLNNGRYEIAERVDV